MEAAAKHPNIVVVTFHDLGRHTGPYGIGTVQTPAFDDLATRGAVLTDAFATAPQCSPSRTSLATGLDPQRHGVLGLAHEPFGWDMLPGVRHIADLLRSSEAAYETHQFGFHHVTMEPQRMGFDHLHGREPGAVLRERVASFIAGADWSDDAPPRYLEINVEEPHRPFGQGGVEPDSSSGVTIPGWMQATPETRADMAALQGAVAHADATLGTILRALDTAGITERTIVVAVADHGIAVERAKCTLYDAGLEITLLIAQPGRIPPARIGGQTTIADVLPTVFDLVGLDVPGNLDGGSRAAELLAGVASNSREFAFAQKTFHTYFDPMRSVRGLGHKLIRNFDATPAVEVPLDIAVETGAPCRQDATHPALELYDLAADPHELVNLAGSRGHVDVQQLLDRELLTWMRHVDDPILRGEIPTPPVMTSRLRDFVGAQFASP